jgi:hypothetical protein
LFVRVSFFRLSVAGFATPGTHRANCFVNMSANMRARIVGLKCSAGSCAWLSGIPKEQFQEIEKIIDSLPPAEDLY